jgi:hypothetical protein
MSTTENLYAAVAAHVADSNTQINALQAKIDQLKAFAAAPVAAPAPETVALQTLVKAEPIAAKVVYVPTPKVTRPLTAIPKKK